MTIGATSGSGGSGIINYPPRIEGCPGDPVELSVILASADSMVVVPLEIELNIMDENEPGVRLLVGVMDDILDVSVGRDRTISVTVPGNTSDILMLSISAVAIDDLGVASDSCDFTLIVTPLLPAFCVNPHLDFPAILFTVYSVSLLVDIERDQVSL